VTDGNLDAPTPPTEAENARPRLTFEEFVLKRTDLMRFVDPALIEDLDRRRITEVRRYQGRLVAACTLGPLLFAAIALFLFLGPKLWVGFSVVTKAAKTLVTMGTRVSRAKPIFAAIGGIVAAIKFWVRWPKRSVRTVVISKALIPVVRQIDDIELGRVGSSIGSFGRVESIIDRSAWKKQGERLEFSNNNAFVMHRPGVTYHWVEIRFTKSNWSSRHTSVKFQGAALVGLPDEKPTAVPGKFEPQHDLIYRVDENQLSTRQDQTRKPSRGAHPLEDLVLTLNDFGAWCPGRDVRFQKVGRCGVSVSNGIYVSLHVFSPFLTDRLDIKESVSIESNLSSIFKELQTAARVVDAVHEFLTLEGLGPVSA